MLQGYCVSEHFGSERSEMLLIAAETPEDALRTLTLVKQWPCFHKAIKWRFIDDGLGGGALIDPADDNHCFRADPRDLEAVRHLLHGE